LKEAEKTSLMKTFVEKQSAHSKGGIIDFIVLLSISALTDLLFYINRQAIGYILVK
jgi:hypothetical protein